MRASIRSVLTLVLTVLPLAVAPTGAKGQEAPDVDSGTSADPTAATSTGATAYASRLFPSGEFVPGFIADPMRPGIYAGVISTSFDRPSVLARGDRAINLGAIGVGGSFGLWSFERPAPGGRTDGVRLDLFIATFSQFNLSVREADLLNADYIVGPSVRIRRGPWAGRFRTYHQSSHLGDELLLGSPQLERVSITFEALDAALIRRLRIGPAAVRAHAGGGVILRSDTDLAPGILEGGVEVRSAAPTAGPLAPRVQPVAAVHLRSLELRDWGTTTSVRAGIEIRSVTGRRGVRVLGVLTEGFLPFGQFFSDTELWKAGLEFQFIL